MHDSYDGRYVDAWSLGCVVLEQIIGSDEFDVVWLSAYTQELMSKRTDFLSAIKRNLQTLIKLPDFFPSTSASPKPCRTGAAKEVLLGSPKARGGLPHNLNALGDCVFALLEPEPTKRLTVQNVQLHAWLADAPAGGATPPSPKPRNRLASLKLLRQSSSAPNLTAPL
jgi:serine/threonine protein kinase